MTEAKAASREKRDSFRIDEDLHFEFRQVSASFTEEGTIEEAFEDNDDSLRLINQLNKIDREASQSLKILSDKNRLLGDFLNSLNRKVDIIGRHLAFNSVESLKSRPKTRVSVCEDGIGFVSNKSLYKDSMIAVRLIFLPNYFIASSFAKVVRCVQKDDKFQIAAKFYKIYDKDRQVISRQVLKSQVSARKRTPVSAPKKG